MKNLAQTCGFGNNLNESLRDRFVTGLSNTETQRVLLTEADLTFKRAVDIASAREAAQLDAEAMKQPNVMHDGDKTQRRCKNAGNAAAKPLSLSGGAKPKTKCSGCGQFHWRSACPYKETVCHACGKKGHLKKCCFKVLKQQKTKRTENVNALHSS